MSKKEPSTEMNKKRGLFINGMFNEVEKVDEETLLNFDLDNQVIEAESEQIAIQEEKDLKVEIPTFIQEAKDFTEELHTQIEEDLEEEATFLQKNVELKEELQLARYKYEALNSEKRYLNKKIGEQDTTILKYQTEMNKSEDTSLLLAEIENNNQEKYEMELAFREVNEELEELKRFESRWNEENQLLEQLNRELTLEKRAKAEIQAIHEIATQALTQKLELLEGVNKEMVEEKEKSKRLAEQMKGNVTIEELEQLISEKEELSGKLLALESEVEEMTTLKNNIRELEKQTVMTEELMNQLSTEKMALEMANEILKSENMSEVAALKEQLEERKMEGNASDGLLKTDEVQELEQKVQELTENNELLKEANSEIQTEIGEILVFTRKQANRTLEESKIEANQMIHQAELQVELIQQKAEKVILEVQESKKTILASYRTMEKEMEQLLNSHFVFDKSKDKLDQ